MFDDEAFGRTNSSFGENRVQNSPFPCVNHFINSAQSVYIFLVSAPSLVKFPLFHIRFGAIYTWVRSRRGKENSIWMEPKGTSFRNVKLLSIVLGICLLTVNLMALPNPNMAISCYCMVERRQARNLGPERPRKFSKRAEVEIINGCTNEL